MIRGLGHLHDPVQSDPPVGAWGLPSAPADGAISFRAYIDKVRDQGDTESCVGQGISRAAHILMQGDTPSPLVTPYPSALHVYYLARVYDPYRHATLEDGGSHPRSAIQALSYWGFVPESEWPFDPAHVNEQPGWTSMHDGLSHKLLRYARVDSGERAQQVKDLLHAGYPVTVAVTVDKSFDGTDGKRPVPAPSGTSRGSHYVCLIGHDPSLGFEMVNSWGGGWGDAGFAYLSPERVADLSTTDIQAIELIQK